MNQILVFAHRRTDWLMSVLERLSKCKGIDSHEVVVVEDEERKSKELGWHVHQAIDYSRPLFKNFRHVENHGTEHFWDNQVRGIELAYGVNAAEFVYLIEDDIMVAPDFLRWSEMAHRLFNPFATVGVNVFSKLGTDPEAVIRSYSEYAHWGVCVRRENLIPALARKDRHPEESFHNFIISNKQPVIFPEMPRAINVGMPRSQTVDFSYEPAKSLYIADDRMYLWRGHYEKQAQWGF